ncbi:MAG: HmuY family protein [Bacteroidales bacterium]|jgi:hypothetical protein|nr:HmuY family protein [Bacteroidales bacterium]
MRRSIFTTIKRGIVFPCVSALCLAACNDKDAPLPDNTANLSAAELGLDESQTAKSFLVTLDRAAEEALTVTLEVANSGAAYGAQYTTLPPLNGGIITLSIPAGQTSAEVTVTKTGDALFEGTETVTFSIATASGDVVVGDRKTLLLTFGAIVSEGGTLTLQGGEGGANAINSVFVDFSTNEMVTAERKSWNFALYTGGRFAVLLNNTTGSTAVEATGGETVGTVIPSADSAVYAASLKIGMGAGSFDIVDDIAGDLDKSVIKEGKVYIVSLGDGQTPLYKVRATRKDANTYTMEYAPANSATISTVDAAINADCDFTYISIVEGKVVSVAPPKKKWDIEWTRATYKASATIPYIFSDFVIINYLNGVQAVQVDAATVSYETFAAADVSSLTFSSDIDVIGGNWRSTTGSGIYQDRFYAVKDPAGNVYKLRFLKFGVGSDGGVRGYPEIEYALVK